MEYWTILPLGHLVVVNGSEVEAVLDANNVDVFALARDVQ